MKMTPTKTPTNQIWIEYICFSPSFINLPSVNNLDDVHLAVVL